MLWGLELACTLWPCFGPWLCQLSRVCAVIPVSRAISATLLRLGGLIRIRTANPRAASSGGGTVVGWAPGWTGQIERIALLRVGGEIATKLTTSCWSEWIRRSPSSMGCSLR